MPEYLSTAELARYLRLNQKKLYAMVAAGQLPAARVSGKWLFPRELIDRWLEEHTVYPGSGVMGALLDQMLILQGSDDWLLSRVLEHVDDDAPIPTATIGSVAGLQALAQGRAHVASCHLDTDEVRRLIGGPAYLVDLVEREQGLIYDRARTPRLGGLRAASGRRLRFAARQPKSGTARLLRTLLRQGKLAPSWTEVGPYGSHLELALAVREGEADVGLGIHIAARKARLAFAPLTVERFALAIPARYFAHARTTRFLDRLIDRLRAECARGLPGYSARHTGRLTPIGAQP